MTPNDLGLPALRWGGTALVTIGLFVGTYIAATDTGGPVLRWYARYVSTLERKLRLQFIFIPGERIVLAQAAGIFLALAGSAAAGFEYWWALVLVICVGPIAHIENERIKRLEKIEDQLDGFLIALANGMKSTPSIGAALSSVVTVIVDPIRQEIDLALKEMKVGSTLDQSLIHMASRIGSRSVDSGLSAILIGRQVGGNLPRVLETTANSLREMRRLDGVIRTKTAEGKMQLWVVGALPIVIAVGMSVWQPGYLAPMTSSFIGYTLLFVAAVAWVSAIVIARKVLTIDI